mmetsp:Transcript_8410/g.27938  ORF Transcript_8410/g.27938 Transcript_8410/m.27938 type:complete len:148 (+) Transcript_8410:125-568(+)
MTSTALSTAIIALMVAQVMKIFTTKAYTGVWAPEAVISSGGMPSSHSSLVVGLAATVGLEEGLESPVFAVAIVFAVVVMYDAAGVRWHAGTQAQVLNQIVYELPPEHPARKTTDAPLREMLGHTKSQVVAGGTLGLAIALFRWSIGV